MAKNETIKTTLLVIIVGVILCILLFMWADYDIQKDADKFCQEHGHKKATDYISHSSGFGFYDVECDGNIYYTEVCFSAPDKWGRQQTDITECKMMKRGDSELSR
jgi:hypothetical protein